MSGAGTFLPVKADDTEGHVMHPEWGTVERGNGRRAQCGAARGRPHRRRRLHGAAACWKAPPAEDRVVRPFAGETSIFITPGYRFRAVDLMLTNFHLPRSTLFMLVSAFSGLEMMQRAYAHAIASGYRFYSYGDACLLSSGAMTIMPNPFPSA